LEGVGRRRKTKLAAKDDFHLSWKVGSRNCPLARDISVRSKEPGKKDERKGLNFNAARLTFPKKKKEKKADQLKKPMNRISRIYCRKKHVRL